MPPTSQEHNTIPQLWKDRSFLLFWGGRGISMLGTAITTVVLPILVYRLTASAFLTSLLATLEVIPYLLFGLFAGVIADRVDRRWLMVGCDLFNTLLIGSIPLAELLNILTLPHIFAVALLSAVAFVWFDAAEFGALPALVGREHIVAANSAFMSMQTIVEIAGPSIGGILAALLGPSTTLGIDALSYLLSAIVLLLIPRAFSTHLVRREQRTQTVREVIQPIFSGIREGLHFLWNHRLVRVLTLLTFGLSFTGGAVNGLLVVYAVQALHLPSTDARIGLLFSAGAIGNFIASLLLPRLSRWIPVGWITLASMTFNLLLLLILAWLSSLVFALVIYAGWELSYALATFNGRNLRQLIIPDHLQSRVNAYARMLV